MAVDTTTRSAPKPRPAAPKEPSRAQTAKREERATSVRSLFELAQFGCLSFGQYADAGAFALHGPAAAPQLAELAEINPWIAKGIDSLDIIGPWAGLLTALMPLTLQILVNHNRVPLERVASLGVQSPAALNAQAQAQLAEMQIAALAQQRESEERLAQARAQMEAQTAPGHAVAHRGNHAAQYEDAQVVG